MFSSPPLAPSLSTPLVAPSLPALDLVEQSHLELLATLTHPGSVTYPRGLSLLAWPPRRSRTEPRSTHPSCHDEQSPQECRQAQVQGSLQARQARANPGSTQRRRPSRRQGARARQAARRGVWGRVDLLVLLATQASCPGIQIRLCDTQSRKIPQPENLPQTPPHHPVTCHPLLWKPPTPTCIIGAPTPYQLLSKPTTLDAHMWNQCLRLQGHSGRCQWAASAKWWPPPSTSPPPTTAPSASQSTPDELDRVLLLGLLQHHQPDLDLDHHHHCDSFG